MPAPDLMADHAVALAGAADAGSKTPDEVVRELAAGGDRDGLERARADLLSRIYQRSDDYGATSALTLVNKALAAVGWSDPSNWKHRRRP
jgi:hypothetical protein